MNKHPECGHDELFIGNWTASTWHYVKWETRRKGDVALVDCGKFGVHTIKDAFPGFIKREEVIEKHPEFLERLERQTFRSIT